MSGHWHQSVDYYCERMDASFWAEPINAVTNIFFIISAFLAVNMWRKSASRNWDVLVLALLIGIVGIGSFIFHTIATRAAALADVIPIAIFIHFGLGVFLYRVATAGLFGTLMGVFGFIIFGAGFGKFAVPYMAGYSAQYIPAALLLLGMSVYTLSAKIPVTKFFIAAFITFVFSLAIRSLDMEVCSYLPFGIHFMWHFLNAIVMYLVFKGVISYSRLSVKV